MHHTVDRNQVVAESRRLVNNPNVHLTVDVLLHKGKIMKCEQNRTVWLEVGAFLAESYRGYAKKVMASFTDIMQPGLHIMNFSSELTVLLQSTVTHIVVLLSFCSLPGMTSSIVSMTVIMNKNNQDFNKPQQCHQLMFFSRHRFDQWDRDLEI